MKVYLAIWCLCSDSHIRLVHPAVDQEELEQHRQQMKNDKQIYRQDLKKSLSSINDKVEAWPNSKPENFAEISEIH